MKTLVQSGDTKRGDLNLLTQSLEFWQVIKFGTWAKENKETGYYHFRDELHHQAIAKILVQTSFKIGDLKYGLIWILNGQKEVGLLIVWILNGIWNPDATSFEIRYFVKNYLKARQNIQILNGWDYSYSFS